MGPAVLCGLLKRDAKAKWVTQQQGFLPIDCSPVEFCEKQMFHLVAYVAIISVSKALLTIIIIIRTFPMISLSLLLLCVCVCISCIHLKTGHLCSYPYKGI